MKNETIEISYEDLKQLDKNNYLLIDIRDKASVAYGMIPNALHISQELLAEGHPELSREKKIILYCTKGIFSKEKALELQIKGYDAYS